MNESSAMTLVVKFATREGVSVIPESIRYRIKDVTHCRDVTGWTEVATAATVNITIDSTENTIHGDSSCSRTQYEERVVSVQANYGTETQYTDEYRYLIRNLRGFQS